MVRISFFVWGGGGHGILIQRFGFYGQGREDRIPRKVLGQTHVFMRVGMDILKLTFF